MPEFSLRLPRFLRSHRSRRSHSPDPSPAGARDDAAPLAPPLSLSHVLSLRHPSTHTDPKQIDDVGIDHLHLDGAAGDSSGQLAQISRPITPINVADTDSASIYRLQDSVACLPVHPPIASDSTSTAQSQHPSCSLTMPSQQAVGLERQIQPSRKEPSPPRRQKQEIFTNAHNFILTEPKFVDNSISNITLTNNFNNSKFMEKLLKETIPGAAADSSARDPPPRCHPGTRLVILERCLNFIVHCSGVKKMRWVVGAAGVGKSAVMQNVAESPQLDVACNASVFFSINGRSDGLKTIMTLSYQFAAKSDLYHRLIEKLVSRDPRLFQSSLSTQFDQFIIQPFIHNPDLSTAGRVLIIIDGLDECNDTHIQVELLHLISNFCTSYPSSSIVWLIASRPEPHITSFFSRPNVAPVHEKEEIVVDSDEARADVERYIRHELTEIRKASDFLGPHWPDEQHLWRLASAAGGLFAYAHTAVRYIGDLNVGDPVSQLSDVLNVIDELPMHDVPQDQHPMALLDALYARILSNVPPKIMINARKLLLLLASDWDGALVSQSEFIVMCNWLGMTADEAYAALNRLRSVLNVPQRHVAHRKALKPFHKSLIDYLSRSGFFANIKLEAQEIKTRCALRVLQEAPGGINFGERLYGFYYGKLARNGDTGDNITITWQADEGIDWDDNRTRMGMYKLAVGEVAAGMKRGDPTFQSESCIRLLTTRFETYDDETFPYSELRDLVFDKNRCHELMKHGILKQIPTKSIPISDISQYFEFKLQYRCPVATKASSDPWDSACRHERVGQWKRGKQQSWTTTFGGDCDFCVERLKRQLEILTQQDPDRAVMVMFTSELRCCVEVQFVDTEDGLSEWTYWLWVLRSLRQRQELGSTI